MITPRFELSQDEKFLYIKIDALLAKISDTEVFVDEDEFCFYSTPYYLRLHLPGSIVENGEEQCTYNEGAFSLKFSKKVHGKFFDGLDMLTSLLTPKGKTHAKAPVIEVISKDNDNANNENELNSEAILWYANPDETDSQIGMHSGYGFANQRSAVFEKLNDEFASVIEIKDPDNSCIKMRMKKKMELESKKFDPDYFIADFLDEDEMVCTVCHYIPPWVKLWNESQEKGVPYQSLIKLNSDEQYQLTLLPKKEYLLDDAEILTSVYLGLVDILFAYCYDVRINQGEKNSESGWTLAKLSSMMSCLVAFNDLKTVIVSSFRRSLSYPLFRSWKLNMLVLSDLTTLFRGGRLQILKSLLVVKEIMQGYELNHILNDLYITDYCVWIQTSNVKILELLTEELSKIVIKHADCDLDLSCWENIAIGELEDVENVCIVSSMSQLEINEGKEKVRKSNQSDSNSSSSGSSSDSSFVDSDDDSYADSDDCSSETSSSSSSSCSGSSWSEDDETEKEDDIEEGSTSVDLKAGIVGEGVEKEEVNSLGEEDVGIKVSDLES